MQSARVCNAFTNDDARAVRACLAPFLVNNYSWAACQHYCCSDGECEKGMCWVGLFEDGEASAAVCGDEFVDDDEPDAGARLALTQ